MTKAEYLALFKNLFDSLQANKEVPAIDKMDIMESVKNKADDLMTEFDACAGSEGTEPSEDDFGTSAVVITAETASEMAAKIAVVRAQEDEIVRALSLSQQKKIRDRVIQIVSEHLGVSTLEIKDDQHLVNDLGADSLDTVELLMGLEDEFELEIPDAKADGVYLVKDIVRNIQAEIANGRGK